MDELLKALPSLLGVVVGGLITFFIQNRTIRKQQAWEREKIKIDKLQKDQEKVFQAYNKILHLEGVFRITYYNQHNGKFELDVNKYYEHIRPIVFDVFHLLDQKVADVVDEIERIFERQIAMEEADEGDDERLGELFQEMLIEIRFQFIELRKQKPNDKMKINKKS